MNLDEEQKNSVRRMAALGYPPEDIAVALGLNRGDREQFVFEAGCPNFSVFNLVQEGVIQLRAVPEVKLHEAAEAGDLDAIKQLEDIRKRHVFENLVRDMDAYE